MTGNRSEMVERVSDEQIIALVNLVTDLADADALDRVIPEVRAQIADWNTAPNQPLSDDVVERVARAHSPETWATIDELRSKAAWYREKIGKVGYRDGSAEREAEFNQRLADEYANEQITRARAAIAAIPPAGGVEEAARPLLAKLKLVEDAREAWNPSKGPIGDGYTIAIKAGDLRKLRAALGGGQ